MGQEGLQIGTAFGISNRDKRITNQGRDFKSGQRDFKSGQRLQIEARGILNRGRFWTHHTIPILEQYEYDAAILHVGINDLLRFNKNSSTLVLICDDIINADLRSRYFILFKSYNRYYKKTRTSHPEVFLGKGVLKICSKFTGEHPCRSAISIKLLFNFIEISLRHECFPINLLHIFRTHFSRNSFGWLLLIWESLVLELVTYLLD